MTDKLLKILTVRNAKIESLMKVTDKWGPERIREIVAEIREMAKHDPGNEVVGWVQWVYAELLKAIRDGQTTNPVTCAAAVLELEELL